MLSLPILIRTFCSLVVFSGLGVILMGLGVIPVDEGLDQVARVFLDPLNIPSKPFLVFLGTIKIVSVARLWGYGPMPINLAFLGLAAASSCGCYGHFVLNELPEAGFAFLYTLVLGYLYSLEGKKQRGSATKVKQ